MITDLTNNPPAIDFGFGNTSLLVEVDIPITVWQNTLYHPDVYNPTLTANGANIEAVSPYEYKLTFDNYINTTVQLSTTTPGGQIVYSNILNINFDV